MEPSGDVAIIGMSCRFPGDGEGVDGFWQSIASGQSAWSQIPPDRFNPSAFWSPNRRADTSATRGGFFLNNDLSVFDAGFFALSRVEAEAMDPQQRFLIEVAYEALESAGVPLPRVAGTRTGVYVGTFTHDYYDMLRKDPENMPAFALHGTASTAMAGRLSWLWDLRGPCLALDTACSSGLVALHLAVQGLRAGESDAALVGATNMLIAPEMFKVLSSASLLAPDGRSKAFDESADGYGRGEGVAVLMLKRIEDAVRDGDPIRAVIRQTACNQDGRTPGMTLPSSEAQAALIREAYRGAGLEMQDTGYVEAHGTGTQAGDQQETQSLSATIALAKKEAQKGKLLVGSVKSNIGHLEACAGLAGIIKTVLILEHGLIPPTITVKTINPKIPIKSWNMSIPTSLTPFPGSGLRRASVNSFGFCGTNAHAILDDADSYLQSRGIVYGNHSTVHGSTARTDGPHTIDGHGNTDTRPLVFVLSAQDREGIGRVRRSLAEFLTKPDARVRGFHAELAHTLNTRRTHHQWKTYAVASSAADLARALTQTDMLRPEYSRATRPPRVGFVFTGQGAQWAGMGTELMTYPIFSSSIIAADEFLKRKLGCPWSAEEELRRPKAESRLGTAEYSQALCTVLQIALVDLLRDWGITPVAVTGHSSGEIAAAYTFGALSRESAWKVAYYRGVLSPGAHGMSGSMMAVSVSPDEAAGIIDRVVPGQVVVACINSPSSVTLSGDTAGVDKLLAVMSEDGIPARKLQVDTAYHSHHMEVVAADYMEAIMDTKTGPSTEGCTMQSSATGFRVSASGLGSAHWVRNLLSPVQFAGAVQDLVRPPVGTKRVAENAVDILVEVGPHSALRAPSLQSLKAIGVVDIPYLSALSRWEDGRDTCVGLAGELFARSFPVDLSKTNGAMHGASDPPTLRTLVDLPRYAWNHQHRYWAETRWAREQRMRSFAPLSLLGAPQASSVAGEHVWRGYMRMKEQPWVADHQIQGSVLYPAAGFLAMAIEAATQATDRGNEMRGFYLRNVQLTSPMILRNDLDVEHSIVLRPHFTGTMSTSSTWTEFVISSSPDGVTFQRNCLGHILVDYADRHDELDGESMRQRIDEIRKNCEVSIPHDAFYERLVSLGHIYGSTFANLSSIRVRPRQSAAIVDIPDVGFEGALRNGHRPHMIHPTVLDAVFHTVLAAVSGAGELTSAMVPKSIESMFVSMSVPYRAGEQLSGVCETRSHGRNEHIADIFMEDGASRSPVLEIHGLCCTKISEDVAIVNSTLANILCTRVVWKPHIDLVDDRESLGIGLTDKHSAFLGLSEVIGLAHHVNPALMLVEIATSPHIVLPSLTIDKTFFDTTSYRIACAEDAGPELSRFLSSVEGYDASQLLSLKEWSLEDESTTDLMIASSDGSVDFRRNIQLLATKKLVNGGRLCLIERLSVKIADPYLSVTGWRTSHVFDDDEYLVTIMTKTPPNVETARSAEQVVILSKEQSAFESELSQELETRGLRPLMVQWTDNSLASSVREKRCICLTDLERPLLQQLSGADFARLKVIVENALHITWAVGHDESNPDAAMITGVLRVLQNETPGLETLTISADADSRARPRELAAVLARLSVTPTREREFRIVNGVPYISRLVPDERLNQMVDRLAGPLHTQKPEMIPYAEASAHNRRVELTVGRVGQLDSVRFQVSESGFEEPLSPDEIEIDVQASGLGRRDVLSAMGQLPSHTLGLEAAGTIRRIGSAVSHLQISERVALIGCGAHASVLRGKSSHAFKIPETMIFEEAAALPIAACTAWYSLVHISRARKGQRVLIHDGAGDVGQAALQLAQHLELEVFATVGGEQRGEESELAVEDEYRILRENYRIADEHIFRSRDHGFPRAILKMTSGRGVDIVLNSLSGEVSRRSWDCLAPAGRFVELGTKDIKDDTRLGMRLFSRGASFTSVNLEDICENQVELMAEIVQGTTPYLTNGLMRAAHPLVSHPISDTVTALRSLRADTNAGKHVLTWEPDAEIPVLRSPAPPLRLGHGVVLLVGGLGGLGQSIARMLIAHGARALCFLSRSAGTARAESRAFLDTLAAGGVRTLTLACDVADPTALATALDRCAAELGPIRGVFQCAAVLRDSLFANMSYGDWTAATHAKVPGSRNLSAALPDVDFFVMLSSFTATFGNRGQANYAAGCAFQDALARARRARGQAAVSVGLGVVRDVGGLARDGNTLGDMKDWAKVWGITEPAFLALMRLCVQATELGIGAQVVTGLGTRAGSLAAGIEPPYYLETDSRFSILASVGGGGRGEGAVAVHDPERPLSVEMAEAEDIKHAQSLVLNSLLRLVAGMLDLPATDLDAGRSLSDYGIDSLRAIEIVNWALQEVHARISTFDVMVAVPMNVFCEGVTAKSQMMERLLMGKGD